MSRGLACRAGGRGVRRSARVSLEQGESAPQALLLPPLPSNEPATGLLEAIFHLKPLSHLHTGCVGLCFGAGCMLLALLWRRGLF